MTPKELRAKLVQGGYREPEGLTDKRLFEIQMMPPLRRRRQLVRKMKDANKHVFREWPDILPLWMVVMLVTGCSAPQAIYLVRDGHAHVKGDREIWCDKKGGEIIRYNKVPNPDKHFVKKIIFQGNITNPDTSVMLKRTPLRLRDKVTVDYLRKPSAQNGEGFFDAEQFPKQDKTLQYLFECSNKDATICLPIKMTDLAKYWDGSECRINA